MNDAILVSPSIECPRLCDDFLSEAVAGLSRPQKTLPCKFLYDEEGSRLFNEICELEEYYPTRTENQILRDNINEIAIKTSAIITIGSATLAALIGAGGLGEPIISGLNLNDNTTILEGAIPAALLAIAAQGLFTIFDRLIIPRGLRLRPA